MACAGIEHCVWDVTSPVKTGTLELYANAHALQVRASCELQPYRTDANPVSVKHGYTCVVNRWSMQPLKPRNMVPERVVPRPLSTAATPNVTLPAGVTCGCVTVRHGTWNTVQRCGFAIAGAAPVEQTNAIRICRYVLVSGWHHRRNRCRSEQLGNRSSCRDRYSSCTQCVLGGVTEPAIAQGSGCLELACRWQVLYEQVLAGGTNLLNNLP